MSQQTYNQKKWKESLRISAKRGRDSHQRENPRKKRIPEEFESIEMWKKDPANPGHAFLQGDISRDNDSSPFDQNKNMSTPITMIVF